MDKTLLRSASVLDSAVLAVLHQAIFSAPWDQAWDSASFARILAMPGALGWILERETAPIGFVLARFTLDEGEILLTGVVPPERGKGHGATLLRGAIAAARQAGVARLFLEYAEPNAGAAALYRSLGFVETGRRRGYYGDAAGRRYDALTCTLELTAPNSIDPPGKPPGTPAER